MLANVLLLALGMGCTPRPAAVVASPDAVRVEAPVVLTAVVVDGRGAVVDVPVSWTTSDSAVAIVDSAGRLTPVRSGNATVRAAVGELYDEVLVEVDLYVSATLEVPGLLTEGVRAPFLWAGQDDSGGPWEGAVACTSSDDAVLAVAEGEIVAVSPGRAKVTCVAAGRTVDADVHVLPSKWDAFAWRRATSVKVGDSVVMLFSRDEVPSDDWVRLTEAFPWRTESGRPAYIVLAELLDLSLAFSCDRGQAIVVVPDDAGLHIGPRIDLGARCVGIPTCEGCVASRSTAGHRYGPRRRRRAVRVARRGASPRSVAFERRRLGLEGSIITRLPSSSMPLERA